MLLDLTPEQRGGLVRGAIVPSPGRKLVVCDFSGIEARVLAWLADDHEQLALFRAGGDPYVRIAAEAIFFCDPSEVTKPMRDIGKVAELALGYGMGWKKFEERAGADVLAAAGTSARAVVDQWRNLRQPVVELWARLESDWITSDGYFADYDDGTKRMRLPSGRELVYREADVHGWKTYVGRRGVERVYGGLLVENLVQTASRCLLARALVEAEDAGLNPVATIHDEVICDVRTSEAEDGLKLLSLIMSEAVAPGWAKGCPISSKGYVAERYRK